MFVSMETPQPNSNYKTVRCINLFNAVIRKHSQLRTVAHRMSYPAGSVVAGEATWPPNLAESFGRDGEAASLGRRFLCLVFLKAVVPMTITSIGKEEYFGIFKRMCLGYM